MNGGASVLMMTEGTKDTEEMGCCGETDVMMMDGIGGVEVPNIVQGINPGCESRCWSASKLVCAS